MPLEENQEPPRSQAAAFLIQKFMRDYKTVMKGYEFGQKIELTKHLVLSLDLMFEYNKTGDEAFFNKYREAENALAEKYGRALTPYTQAQFYLYFHFDIVITEKDIYSPETFNTFSAEEQQLSQNEIVSFLRSVKNSLNNALNFLFSQKDVDFIPKFKSEPEAETLSDTEKDKSITKARQLLAIYYLLTSGLNIHAGTDVNTSDAANLVHLLTGTKFTSLQNSEIYKMYRKMPNYKKDAHLIEDLKFIRPYFLGLNMNTIVELIDTEIKTALAEVEYGKRNKLR